MNPIRLFLKNTAYQSFNQLFLRIISAVYGIIIIRFLSKEDYGLWALIIAIVGFTNLVSHLGLPTMIVKSISQFYKDDLPRAASYYRFNLKVYSLITFTFFLILFFLAPLISKIYNLPQATNLIRLSAPLFVLISFFSFYEWTFTGLNEFKPFSLKICLPREILVFLLVIIFLWKGLGIAGLILAQIIGIAVAVAIAIKLISTRFRGKAAIDKRWVIRSALELVPSNLAYACTAHTDIIIIGALLSTPLLAAYRACLTVIIIPYGLFPIYTFILPTFNLLTKERANVLLNDILRLTVIISLPIMALISSFSKEIIVILFGQKYADSSFLLSIFSLILLGKFLQAISEGVMTYLGRFKAMSKIMVIMMFVYIFLLIVFIKSFGLVGAVMATIALTYSLSLLMSYDSWRNGMTIQLKPLFEIILIASPLLINILCMNISNISFRIFLFIFTIFVYLALLNTRKVFTNIELLGEINFRR